MPVPSTIADLTTSEATNSPADSETITATTRPSDYLRAHAAIIKILEGSVTSGLATKTELATATAAALAAVYPVGSIYINASVATSPATLFGFGTWVAFGTGRTLVGLDSGNAIMDTVEETGGSADAIVVSHTHTVTDPGHVHSSHSHSSVLLDGGPFNMTSPNYGAGNTGSNTTGITIDSEGISGTNANYQPFITVYMWKRTA